MSRSNTRIQNLTKVTTLADNDVIPIGPASGDRAKGITKENLEKQFEGDGLASIITETSISYTALITDDYVVGLVSGITLSFAGLADANKPTWFVNASASNITLDGGSETIPNGAVLSSEQVRGFLPTTAGWLEL